MNKFSILFTSSRNISKKKKLESSNGCHSGVVFFKPEKNLEFFRLKKDPRDDYPGRLE